MTYIVTLPDIGEGVVEGEVIEWLKHEGDLLEQDEPVVVIMTDKATVELPAPQQGRLVKCHYLPGQMAIVGKPLYEIASLENVEQSSASYPPPTDLKAVEKPVRKKIVQEKAPKALKTGVLATPKVRHLAKEMKIDLSLIQGSGKEGRILASDLREQKALKDDPRWHQPEDEEMAMIGIPQLMSKKMVESKEMIPHFSYFEAVDVTRLISLRGKLKRHGEEKGVHVTYMPFVLRALSLTLKKFPQVNSSYDPLQAKILLHTHQHIGIAMATEHGLIVPVLKDVQAMNLEQIIYAYAALMERAQNNRLDVAEMKGGTITVSNYGTAGHGQWATPIINYPEVAILAISRIQQQAVVRNAAIDVGNMINLSWSFDHRLIDGYLAVQFSHYFCQLLQNPASLL